MKRAVLDDHLLRDLLADEPSAGLTRLLVNHQPCTTNLYLLRLCKSTVSAQGGQLTGSWSLDRRLALGRKLLEIDSEVEIMPMQTIAMRMAEIGNTQRVSTLGAEAIAASEYLKAVLVVWVGDDGLGIRTAAKAHGVAYRTIKQ